MAQQYFHHTFEDLNNFNYEVRYNPNSLISRIKEKTFGKAVISLSNYCFKDIDVECE